MEKPIKMDDLGVPIFLETPIYSMNNDTNMSHIDMSCNLSLFLLPQLNCLSLTARP